MPACKRRAHVPMHCMQSSGCVCMPLASRCSKILYLGTQCQGIDHATRLCLFNAGFQATSDMACRRRRRKNNMLACQTQRWITKPTMKDLVWLYNRARTCRGNAARTGCLLFVFGSHQPACLCTKGLFPGSRPISRCKSINWDLCYSSCLRAMAHEVGSPLRRRSYRPKVWDKLL